MKLLFTILVFCFSLAVSGQSFYTWPSSGTTLQNDEKMTVVATRSAYGITLDRAFESLPETLKNKIADYLNKTTRTEFQGMGTVRLPIVKRSGNYYVVVNDSYNELEAL